MAAPLSGSLQGHNSQQEGLLLGGTSVHAQNMAVGSIQTGLLISGLMGGQSGVPTWLARYHHVPVVG